jgi:hypothetical protein
MVRIESRGTSGVISTVAPLTNAPEQEDAMADFRHYPTSTARLK